MSSVELGALSAMSYCWHKHDDSFFLARAVKAIAGAVKATFSKFTVELLKDAKPLMERHPSAWFAEPVGRALVEYSISHAPDTSRQPATAGSPPPSATNGSPPPSATAGSPPPLPQPQRARVNSPLSFSLKETDATRIQFVSGEYPTVVDVSNVYKKMRAAAGELWVENAKVICRAVKKDEVDDIAFGNKNHYVISKYQIAVPHPTGEGYSIEEVFHVIDRENWWRKLVRIGSFCEAADGSTTGGEAVSPDIQG
ncbi:hypothetical protein [Endozoicomonas sp. YOMI1]|uniref:hypothetical protein n=1 Tax=Endozoicomonas sp. YOMI1 TaxID=2828739 RepID=UPI002148E0B1|nr:hypothetical protein [Endozoicomonas sp. YOMI1]